MSLLPGLEAELLGAARRTDPSSAPVRARPPRRGRHHRRFGLYSVVAFLALSGGAYAARGLWQPVLGNDVTGRPAASYDAPPREQLDVLGVLRRPQTDADRGIASSAALRGFRPADGDVRTGWVRRLTTLANGSAVVLIPVDQRRGDDTAYAKRDDAQLCLAVVPTRGEMPAPQCTPTSGLLVGEGLTTEVWDPLTPQQERDRAAAIRRAERAGDLPRVTDPNASVAVSEKVAGQIERATYASRPKGGPYSVSLVPDVVHSVRFVNTPGQPVRLVRDNLVVQHARPGEYPSMTSWIDVNGRTLNADGVRVAPSAIVP
ncbi:MAG: hypothetical protein Q7T55_08150 [Solirubrobacteraceae bacterium]|nr:hypothetical protein [Solirubrobacteraceae bacterium]